MASRSNHPTPPSRTRTHGRRAGTGAHGRPACQWGERCYNRDEDEAFAEGPERAFTDGPERGDAIMLDIFIIEKIRRERERGSTTQIPLQLPLERPPLDELPREQRSPERPEDEREGGVVIVDFTI